MWITAILITILRVTDSDEAIKIKNTLGKRLAKFKLELNKEKTKLVSFSKKEFAGGIKQGAFDFLGFTFYIGMSQKGCPIAKIKTSKKRFKDKLKNVKTWIKITRNKYPRISIKIHHKLY